MANEGDTSLLFPTNAARVLVTGKCASWFFSYKCCYHFVIWTCNVLGMCVLFGCITLVVVQGRKVVFGDICKQADAWKDITDFRSF